MMQVRCNELRQQCGRWPPHLHMIPPPRACSIAAVGLRLCGHVFYVIDFVDFGTINAGTENKMEHSLDMNNAPLGLLLSCVAGVCTSLGAAVVFLPAVQQTNSCVFAVAMGCVYCWVRGQGVFHKCHRGFARPVLEHARDGPL